MEGLSLAFQYHLAKFLSDPLLAAFSEEEDLEVLENIGGLLRDMALNFIQSTEHPLATRIFFYLKRRRHQFAEDKNLHAQMLAKILDIKLDQSTQKFLMDDLKSSDPYRQRNAAQLLGDLGQVSMPLLIDIVKQEDDFRVRKIAVNLLEKLGSEAANILKQQLVLEVDAKERSRILEIVDSLTKELMDELPQVLGDENPSVRNAAFGLAVRLNNSQVAELLLDYAKNRDIGLATAALKCLGKIKPPTAVGELISILSSTKEEKRLIACCRTLGQFANPTSIEPLAKILTSNSGFFRRKKRSALLRATAAFTLGQISHPRVQEVLSPFVNDSDPRIRQIAQTVTNSKALSPS
jgi:HEAT repeat protein